MVIALYVQTAWDQLASARTEMNQIYRTSQKTRRRSRPNIQQHASSGGYTNSQTSRHRKQSAYNFIYVER